MYFLDSVRPSVISTDWEKYISTWASPVIWILLGGFFLAMGAQITAFDQRFSRLFLRYFGNKPYNILLGCMLITGLLSMFMSNTATTAMMIAILTPIVQQLDAKDPFIKAMFLGVATSATLGGMGTVIGSPPNAIALGIIQNNGIDFGFSDWMLMGFPIACIFIVLTWGVLKIFFKTHYNTLYIPDTYERHNYPLRNTRKNRLIVAITFILTIGLWLTSMIHQIPVAVISYIPILTFSVAGVIHGEDLRLLPWDTLILVAGGLTLGIVISDTGLTDLLVSQMPVFSNHILMLLIMGWMTTLLSNIMSNTAAASVLIPVGVSLLPDHALLVSLVIGLSASTALFLPISTPPNAIAFSSGYLKQSDFRLFGAIYALIGPPILILIAEILFN